MTREEFLAWQRQFASAGRWGRIESGELVVVACGCGESGCEGWAVVTPADAAGWDPEVGRVTDWDAYDAALEEG
ncbi:hypothetical protein [Microbacterium stercoris]|uniref:Uncharacterized protein n=1 Tax=Microbacterium stercoris TaxID=2820289 RepID=A0A939QN71_9MICO|nr:hypothetical protein [Microbacterium stercoris]MBO3663745.1 hypothetical protein [Microbacterium stercoris]